MSGAGHMSDLLSPVVGGLLPPAGVILFLVPPLWGLSGYPRRRLDIAGRGGS